MRKVKAFRQHDSMLCGITCLGIIADYYGRSYSESFLSDICKSTSEGVSLLGINEAAGKLGFHTVCGRLDVNALLSVPLPCILHWNQNHFVVLYKIKKGKTFYIADPGRDSQGIISQRRRTLGVFQGYMSRTSSKN